jgi:hypothetical protein
VKKSNLIVLACVIASIGALSLSIVSLASILPRQEYSGYGDSHSSDLPYLQGVTKSYGYYNISLAFSNVTDSERLDNILVNPNSPETVTDLTIYVNGTIANKYPFSYLQSGDSLQVNLTLLCTAYASGSTLYLCVMGDTFGCGREVVLP